MADRRTQYLLVYGTLRAGEAAHAALGLERALTRLGTRIVAARLYDLGDYPGLVFGGGRVEAELYSIRAPSVLEKLDAYEGFDEANPASSLFVRKRIGVPRYASAAVPRVDAWIYVYNGSVEGRRRICRFGTGSG